MTAPVVSDVAAAARARLAQIDFLEYCARVIPVFDVTAAHVVFLCALLERVAQRKLRRLAITAPPGHGKSTLTQAWTSWLLSAFPGSRVLMLSASEALARRNSRIVRGQVLSEEYPWRSTTLDSEAVTEWELAGNKSSVRAIGSGGVVTGFRSEAIVCDDVQPDRMTAATRDSLEEWFRGVLSTRLEPNGVVVAIQTRWSTDDLIARLIEGESGSDWVHVNLPAICDSDEDPLHREFGAALWPARWPVELLERKRREVGAREFDSQYQGSPIPDGGLVFKNEWLQQRYESAPAFTRTVVGFDGAWRTGKQNDYSAAVLIGFAGGLYYVQHAWQARLEYADLRQRLIDYHGRVGPDAYAIEDAASGTPLLSDLRRSALNLVPVKATGDKISRAESVTPLLEAGKVLFKQGEPWLDELVANLRAFPGGKHDDLTDAFVHALSYLRRSESSSGWSFAVVSTHRGSATAGVARPK